MTAPPAPLALLALLALGYWAHAAGGSLTLLGVTVEVPEGDYYVAVAQAPGVRVAAAYPAGGLQVTARPSQAGVTVEVSGPCNATLEARPPWPSVSVTRCAGAPLVVVVAAAGGEGGGGPAGSPLYSPGPRRGPYSDALDSARIASLAALALAVVAELAAREGR